MSWLRQRYGAGPLHLVLSVACLAFSGYLVWTVLPAANAARLFVWIGLAAAVHDLLLWPFYAGLDRLVVRLRERRRKTIGDRFAVPLVNHIRVPVVLSAVTLLISFPLVLRHSEPAYHTATGLTEQPYLWRWLSITGSAFAISAVIYIGRVSIRRARRARARRVVR